MQRFLICLVLAMQAFPVLAQDYLPRDVQRFMDRRESCDQVRRIKDADSRILKPCMGTDKELAQLKRKYAANSTIMQILNQFEASIEVAEAPVRRK
ncbi:hypothetical protein AB4Z32_07770 [Massilia sp. 2TAF26]|uniref:hypothetical protein n=1 Tax=Massilia sp. 2TAF26 TaxID=3233012 RepID=UPI003F947A5B